MKSTRGPKLKTPENSPKSLVLPGPISPISPLKAKGKREFERVVSLLRRRGTLDRVDVGTITELARVKALLDAEHAKDDPDVKKVGILTNLKRGLTRELGLTLQPSRAAYRAIAGHGGATDLRAKFGHLLGE